jgi:excisionase family DNA binding protein
MPMTDTSELLTVSQAAEALNASSQTIRNWIRAGRLDGVRVGHRFLIPRAHVDRLRGGGSSAAGEGPWEVGANEAHVALPRARATEGEPSDVPLGG